MALPMDDPERDYALITQDTRRVGEVIVELNALGTRVDTAEDDIDAVEADVAALGSGFALSPANDSMSVYIGDGSTPYQTIFSGGATTVDLTAGSGASVVYNNGGHWSTSSGLYTVPATGVYMLVGHIRLSDGIGSNFNFGIGISTSNTTDSNIMYWHKYFTGAGGRFGVQYVRMAELSSGNSARLYCYADTVSPTLVNAALQIWRIT